MGFMKKYRGLLESLPAKTCIFAVFRADPPNKHHAFVINYLQALSKHLNASCKIFILDSGNVLSAHNIKKYLGYIISSDISDHVISTNNLDAELNSIRNKYNTIYALVDAGQERKFIQHGCKVIAYPDINPDSISDKLISYAVKGDMDSFKRYMPISCRDIDIRHIFNDIRTNKNMPSIKEPISLSRDVVREKYFRNEIFNVGDLVESINGEPFIIVKRGTNHLLVKDAKHAITSKWIHEVTPR